MFNRSSGVLVHITSLPGPHGIGDLGEPARHFVQLLHRAGQHFWQVLPLGPVGAGNSPYDARSTFAGFPLLISLDDLFAAGLLDRTFSHSTPRFRIGRVEYPRVAAWKERAFREAFERFQGLPRISLRREFHEFVELNSNWLNEYALYQSIRSERGGEPWFRWDRDLRLRQNAAINAARGRLADEIGFNIFVQFLFDRQWHALNSFAQSHGVTLMGDVPIYVARDSADVWANQEQFRLDEQGQPIVQAGVPPDMFSETGQLWGNPVYDWDRMRHDDYSWWQRRISRTLSQTDIVRIDHFRGFAAGWQVDAEADTAIDGEWVTGPGKTLFERIEDQQGRIPIVVEDLGVITPDVEALRDDLGFPGMKVLQFAFDGDQENPYLPHNAPANSMMYTGTHDNDTTLGWFDSLSDAEKRIVQRYARAERFSVNWDLIRLAWSSASVLACAPIQDVLGLSSAARMNIPGTAEGNWSWRMVDFKGLRRRATFLRALTEMYGRSNPPLNECTSETRTASVTDDRRTIFG